MEKDAAYPTLTQSQDLPPPRERTDSHVRIKPGRTGFGGLIRPAARRDEAAHDVVSELSDEQLTLTMSLLCVQNLVSAVPRDPSAHAAAQSIRERIADLHELRNALATVNLDACDPRLAPLFAADAPLTDYMRGLYAWTKAVIRALEEIAAGLRVLDPDWALLRARLEDSASFYLADLERPIAMAATRLRLRVPDVDLDEHLVELFWAASYLAKSLENKFG